MAAQRLPEVLEQFVNTEDWEQARRVVERNRELLSDQALALLHESVADYRAVDRDDVADYLQEHETVLRRSREVGIEQAFAEAADRARETEEVRRQQMDALRPEKPTPLQQTVWKLLDAVSPEEVDQVFAEHPELSRDPKALEYVDELMQRATEADYREAAHYLQEFHELLRAYFELPPLLQAMREFMAVPTWTESRDVLKRHPELMSDEALQTLDSLIETARAQEDEATVRAMETYREVIARSREVGPDRAIEEITQPEEPHPRS
ncbi:MAG: hypothetical protein K6V36_09715 [Anaerolineae bacterium]|nr:hypothetical protein [Anaerolineae bacterium]